MIDSIFVVVLIWMRTLAPERNVDELAWNVAAVAASYEEAALLTAVAYRESGLDPAAVGDHGRSVCAFQILNGSPSLLTEGARRISRDRVALARRLLAQVTP